MIYILLAATLALGGVTVAAALNSRAGHRRLAEQMRLVMQSQHATLGQTQTSDKKLDWLRYEQQQSKEMQEHHFEQHSKALDHQRKSLEHQRVLLASLGRQLQDIDQIYDASVPSSDGGTTTAQGNGARSAAESGNKGQAQTSLQPHPAIIRKLAQDKKPVSLSQLFGKTVAGEKQRNLAAGERRNGKGESAGALIKSHVAAERGLRRVANG